MEEMGGASEPRSLTALQAAVPPFIIPRPPTADVRRRRALDADLRRGGVIWHHDQCSHLFANNEDAGHGVRGGARGRAGAWYSRHSRGVMRVWPTGTPSETSRATGPRQCSAPYAGARTSARRTPCRRWQLPGNISRRHFESQTVLLRVRVTYFSTRPCLCRSCKPLRSAQDVHVLTTMMAPR